MADDSGPHAGGARDRFGLIGAGGGGRSQQVGDDPADCAVRRPHLLPALLGHDALPADRLDDRPVLQHGDQVGGARGSGPEPSALAAGIRDSQLHDPSGGSGPDRLDAQYLRANIDPSERYVLALPGTTRYRLAADGSGYDNLVLAGDWTRTDWNVGCIEAAVQSGINAAAAIEARDPES